MKTEVTTRRTSGRDAAMMAAGVLVALVAFGLWTFMTGDREPAATEVEEAAAPAQASPDELVVRADILKAAGIETATATVKPHVEFVRASGTVEANELQAQDVTPLVSGRIERLSVVEGTTVRAGAVLLTMSSPEVAELQGSLRAAEARLVEAQATLTRTRRLVELGAGAGKDLIAAEAGKGAAQAEVAQFRQRLAVLGGNAGSGNAAVASTTSVRAASSATVVERLVNPGQWIAAGTVVLKLANLSTVWVVVNLPEARLPSVHVGAPVEIRVAALDNAVLTGKVGYIESQLDPETRTAPVRVEVSNPGQRLRFGMFVQAAIEGRRTGGDALMIPSSAVQRIGERTVVFVPADDAGKFRIRDVELGDESEGSRVVVKGLRAGERVVSKGGFTLKSQLLKGQFGEDEELGGPER
ncbi:MAG TPA: efflux RND transporter periplasmic adaptor subunit [Vicinamibacterales bacterium]|nr:efflux RND transporter periplasmic adaptor subunit [Vicinamibacterales bacterium]